MGKRQHRTHSKNMIKLSSLTFVLIVLFLLPSCEKSRLSKPDSATLGKNEKPKNQKTIPPKNTDNGTTDDKKGVVRDIGPEAPAIYFMSGLKGYTEPCGCTLDIMLGGLDRLVAYFDDSKKFNKHNLSIHVGDLFFENKVSKDYEKSEKARVDLIIDALGKLDIKISVPGPKDFALGAPYLFDALKRAHIKPLAQNLIVPDHPISDSSILEISDLKVGFVGIVDPLKYAKIAEIKTSPPMLKTSLEKIKKADIKILLVSGDNTFARQHAEGFDFVVVGEPRETDQSDFYKDAWTLEPYDQGRYVGILKIYNVKKPGPFQNANKMSKSKLEKINRQKERLNAQITELGPKSERTSFLRKRLAELKKEEKSLKNAKIEIAQNAPSFIWRSVPMLPEFRNDEAYKKKREDYNKSLKQLSQSQEREIVPLKKGQAEYVGSAECAKCHVEETKAWKATDHSGAFATLEKRDKEFDPKCVGCHTIGFEKPGGSVLGKYSYESEVKIAKASRKISKDLKNVGCENCHGPGSFHLGSPNAKSPMQIVAKPSENACQQCHVPEHSPRFNFESYLKNIVVPGHGL